MNDVFLSPAAGITRMKFLRIYNRLREMLSESANFTPNSEYNAWDGYRKGQ